MEVEKLAIAKLELGPGDVLVVQSKNRVPREVLDRIKTYVEPQLPHGVKILVIDRSVTLSVLTAADIASRTS